MKNEKIKVLIIHNSGLQNANYRRAVLEKYPYLGKQNNYITNIRTLGENITDVYDKIYIDLDSIKQQEFWDNDRTLKIQLNHSKPHTQYQWFSLTGRKKLTTNIPFKVKQTNIKKEDQ